MITYLYHVSYWGRFNNPPPSVPPNLLAGFGINVEASNEDEAIAIVKSTKRVDTIKSVRRLCGLRVA